MTEGDELPEASVVLGDGTALSLASLAGAPVVLYFYPRDDTSGCTREAADFSALADRFAAAGTRVLGISRDSADSHARFARKHALAVELATDADGSVCEAFGVWGEKRMYGRVFHGIERATFLFGADGRLARAWRKVKVAGHADAVLAAAERLAGDAADRG